MGVDWLPMQPKADYSREQLMSLMDQQAYAYVQYGGGLYEDLSAALDPVSEIEKQYSLQRYIKLSRELAAGLDFFKHYTDQFPTYRRVSVISGNPIFPIEWRIHTVRSYLPDQLPAITQQWKSYAEVVWQGGHQAFLLDLFLYLRSRALRELWEILQFMGERVSEMTNAFTQKPKFKIVHGRLKSFPAPPHFDPPLWIEEDSPTSAIDIESERDYKELMQYQQNIELLRRDWKYSVPSKMKPPPYTSQTFDDYLTMINQKDWLQEFFDWLDECIRRGYGLYLDG